MNEDNISLEKSLEDIWSQTVGDGPAPDPYVNCGSCSTDCFNPANNPAPVDFDNIARNAWAKLTGDPNYPYPTAAQRLEEERNRVIFQDTRSQKLYGKSSPLDANVPPVPSWMYDRMIQTFSSSSNVKIVKTDDAEANGANSIRNIAVLAIEADDLSFTNLEADAKRLRATTTVYTKEGASQTLNTAAFAFRMFTQPRPAIIEEENCEKNKEDTEKATKLTEGLGGENLKAGSDSRFNLFPGNKFQGGAGLFLGQEHPSVPDNKNSGDRNP